MADSVTIIDTITSDMSGIEARVNENFDATSPAMAFGHHASACSGLTFAIYGGIAPVSGVPTAVSNQTFALTASVTNYLRRNANGSFTVTTSAPTGWPGPLASDAVALYAIVTGVSSVTSYSDYRLAAGQSGNAGTNGGGVTIGYVFSTTTTDSDPGNGLLRLSNATQNTATVIRADLLDELGVDYTALLDTLDASTNAVKGSVLLSKSGDPSKWLTFNLTARATPAGYRNLTVANTGSSAASPFANADRIVLSFSRTGDGGSGFTGGTLTSTLVLRTGGTAAASDPITFVSGSLLTAPVVGTVEFLTDKWYGTISTGTARKEIALWDAAGTSGRVPFETTNGRLKDDSGLTYDTVAGITTSKSVNGGYGVSVTNSSTGTAGGAALYVNNSANLAQYTKLSTGYTTNGLLVADQLILYNSTGQMLLTNVASSPIIFAVGGFAAANEVIRINAVTKKSGYGTPTNNANQGSFDATTITLANLAKHVAQLSLDLKAIGIVYV